MAYRKRRKQRVRKPAKVVRKYIRKVLKNATEPKYCDAWLPQTAVTWSGVVLPISLVSQGTDNYNQRIGDNIKATHLEIKGSVVGNGLSNYGVSRCLVFRDKESNGTAPVVTDVLQQSGTGLGPYSPLQVRNLKRYTIISDRLLKTDLSSQPSAAGGTQMVSNFHIRRKLNNNITFRGPTATQIDALGGQIYVLLITDDNVNVDLFQFFSRITYTDM